MEAFRYHPVEPDLRTSAETKVFYAIGFCEVLCCAALRAYDRETRGTIEGGSANVSHGFGDADDLQRAAVRKSI